MKSQKSIARKAQKARARRRDFIHRVRINSNVPTVVREEKKEKFRSVIVNGHQRFQHDGLPMLEHDGYKTVKVKEPQFRNPDPSNRLWPQLDEYRREVGMIQYPRRRAYFDRDHKLRFDTIVKRRVEKTGESVALASAHIRGLFPNLNKKLAVK